MTMAHNQGLINSHTTINIPSPSPSQANGKLWFIIYDWLLLIIGSNHIWSNHVRKGLGALERLLEY